VNELADFAQRIGTYLIGRKGIMKEGQDGRVTDGKNLTDWVFLRGAFYAIAPALSASIAAGTPASETSGNENHRYQRDRFSWFSPVPHAGAGRSPGNRHETSQLDASRLDGLQVDYRIADLRFGLL
jgi:hypothetical protein